MEGSEVGTRSRDAGPSSAARRRRVFLAGLKGAPRNGIAAGSKVIRPEEVRRRIHHPLCLLLALPHQMAYDRVSRWIVTAGARILVFENLEWSIEEAAAIPLRKPIPVADWAPPSIPPLPDDPLGREVVFQIPLLLRLTVEDLAADLGKERHYLNRFCRARFGRHPKDLLWDYRVAYTARRATERATKTAVAMELGYADRANLSRAFEERGVPMPPFEGDRRLPN